MRTRKKDDASRPALTGEQKAIIAAEGPLKINAVAGSGKTSTIMEYAATRPKEARILYLAFNRTVRLEAEKRFATLGLANVRIETAHSLAYRHVVPRFRYSVRAQGYKTRELAELLGLSGHGEKHGEYILANHIGKYMSLFCNSDRQKVQELDYLEQVSDEKARQFVKTFYEAILRGTRVLLAKMDRGEIECTHDFYLKKFQLLQPVLDFDYILFDEGQDASPAMLDIFLRQKATRVIVGDSHQQIYSWRHAINAMGKVNFPSYALTHSFRFGKPVAELAKAILAWKRFLGEAPPVSIEGRGGPAKTGSQATIARSNLGLLLAAINYITDHPKTSKLYFEGNIHSYTYADEGASLYDVLHLYNGKYEAIRDPLIRTMTTLEDLKDYVEKTEDAQLGMMIEIVEEYGNEIYDLLRDLKAKHVGDAHRDEAEMIFSTVHRAKGMEYDSVFLADDFVTESKLEWLSAEGSLDDERQLLRWNEEINLLYVAVTRTRGHLSIPATLLPKGFVTGADITVRQPSPKEEPETAPKQAAYQRPRNRWQGVKDQAGSYRESRLVKKNTSGAWTEESDESLRRLLHQGVPISRMAAMMVKSKGAVLKRLRELGCLGE